MKSKLISIPYTVGIIKPHIALKNDEVEDIYKLLDKHNFEIFHQKRKILSKEEVLNLFYNYRHRDFYPEIEEHMLTAESIILLLINKIDSVYDPEKELDIKLESPIVRWKQLIGNKDPDQAVAQEPIKALKIQDSNG
jgi:nucleoside diphosphate kinase